MKIILVGRGSFIAQAFLQAANLHGISCQAFPHDAALDGVIQPDDLVVNFAINPRYRTEPYSKTLDFDLKTAEYAAAAGAHFNLLSSRRVYGPDIRWNALETARVLGDESQYGKNKATTEKAVRQACGENLTIFRLANIFGYEYRPSQMRGSFIGGVLWSLRQTGQIRFDMDPQTRRDFLPVEFCGQLLLDGVRSCTKGIFNLGSGIPTSCSDIAKWIVKGYGSGLVVSTDTGRNDEFFLNMDKWRGQGFGFPVTGSLIQDYCTELGRRLKCEKS